MRIYRDGVSGKKLYPVANRENNEHKIDTMVTRAENAMYDAMYAHADDKTIDEREKKFRKYMRAWERTFTIDGMIYASYPHYETLREMIATYELTRKH